MDSRNLRAELRVIRRLARYVTRYKTRLTWAIVCSLIVSVLGVGSLMLLKPIVEAIFNPESQSRSIVQSPICPVCGHVILPVFDSRMEKKNSPVVCPICGYQGSIGKSTPPGSPLRSLLTPYYALRDRFYALLVRHAQISPLATLAFSCLCFLFLVAVNGVFRYVQEYTVHWVGSRAILDLQHDLFEHLSRFNAAYFAHQRVGSILSYLTVDIRVIGLTVFNAFGQLILDPFHLLVAIGFLFLMQWKLTILYSLIFPVLVWTMRYFSRKNRRAGREAQNITARLGAFLQEHFSHIRLVQGYGMLDYQRKKFGQETLGVFRATMSMVRAKATSSPLNEFIGIFAVCGILLFGGYAIFKSGSFSGSDFVVYIVLLGTIYQPVRRLERSIQEVQHGLAAAERVLAVLDTQAVLPESPDAVNVDSFHSEIRFEHVSFSYEPQRPVLDDVSFTARKGELVALVGPSGAGKTTLVNLVPRFYDPDFGQVLLDGRDLKTIRLESLRRLISLVPQDVLIFGDSVWANITCGDLRYTRDQVVAAAKAAFAHEFISTLPQGYETSLGERGVSLSGGQCQRIAIARAFLRNSPILILDEATSSLDSESERHIKLSLERLMEGRTAMVIAHRLSTILHADKIVVIDRGRIVSEGKHQELLQQCDLYRRLYRLQFAGENGLVDSEPWEPLVGSL